MSDATIVARELQDLAAAVSEVAGAVRAQEPTINVDVAVPEAPPPSVVVNVPEQPAPSVVVNVPEQPAPTVNVEAPRVEVKPVINVPKGADPSAYEVTITERTDEGFISKFVIRPI